MRARRGTIDFLLKGCGLRHLYGSKFMKFARSFLLEIDLQHFKDSNPCQSFIEREDMYKYLNESTIKGDAIDYLEFGVFRGASIRCWASLNVNPGSRFYGFDSFEGLPEDWTSSNRKGAFDVGGIIPTIDDSRVEFVKGLFADTVPAFLQAFEFKNRIVIHIDADLYSSSLLALVLLGPYMRKGTLIVFDEFYDRDHEFKALMDWQIVYRRNFLVLAQTENYSKVCVEVV